MCVNVQMHMHMDRCNMENKNAKLIRYMYSSLAIMLFYQFGTFFLNVSPYLSETYLN